MHPPSARPVPEASPLQLPVRTEIYLQPLQPLAHLTDTFSQLQGEDLELAVEGVKRIKSIKVDSIASRARKATLTRAELICSSCDSPICAYFNATAVTLTPTAGTFRLTGTFGSVYYTEQLEASQVSGFTRRFSRFPAATFE